MLLTPNTSGYYGDYGGKFIPEILTTTFDELIEAFQEAKADPKFWKEYVNVMQTYSCRPTPVTRLDNFSELLGGRFEIYCKREDLNHTGAHKANNVMGQGLLVKRMGKSRVIAETGAGQHGVATATMAARFGLDCVIYMGALDVERQRPNVFWMEQLGAEVISVTDGTATLKDAINAAMRDWAESMENTHYVLGTTCGPHPFPEMVSYFQSLIGEESKTQMQEQAGRLPDRVYACVGGGSNASGIFLPFLEDEEVSLVGVEAGGHGIETGEHAARFAGGSVGIAQGYKTYFFQNTEGQMQHTHSIAAGLDYIGVSPILSHLHDQGRVRFCASDDDSVIEATKLLIRREGIIPALESSHAFAGLIGEADQIGDGEIILVNLSGRGDKDIFNIAEAMQDEKWQQFIREKASLSL
ncbi:MAG: tryptophan synthase subunit beta [SAR324 cluster bacterium]|jgi:tryptophan synthase beta chain|nr:tryptophan synthase subunit beta [SAR324 cluster bacterium]|tara:strand:- start:2353 stop:3588 length:1236 start_codon:yes stop_codon:yes gene_type:complete